jgi:hypothetical protein
MPDLPKVEKQADLIENLAALLPPKERDAARTLLSKGDAESIQLLTDLRWNEHDTRRVRGGLTVLSGLLLLLGSLIVGAFLGPAVGYVAALGLVVLVLSTLTWTCCPTRRENAAIAILLSSENPTSIGPILECMHLSDRVLCAQAKASLTRLLPHLTTEICERLPPRQRGYLYDLLNYQHRDKERELRLTALTALRQAGDRTCLGAIYLLAAGDASTPAAHSVRAAASECLEHLLARIDFSPLSLPRYIDSAYAQMRREGVDLQVYATCLLNLRQMLRQLTPANYQSMLSEWQRDNLYRLLLPRPSPNLGHPVGKRELDLEIVWTAERLGDTRAIKSFMLFARNPASGDRSVQAAVRKMLPTLEALVEREKESQTLLRGTGAPDAHPEELLRAALPDAFAADPTELLRASVTQQPVPQPATKDAEEPTRLHIGIQPED